MLVQQRAAIRQARFPFGGQCLSLGDTKQSLHEAARFEVDGCNLFFFAGAFLVRLTDGEICNPNSSFFELEFGNTDSPVISSQVGDTQ
jgi:hypothetical protein